ncbi:sensor domain-containing diguanylate cyclase [Solemya pervernicosa gill symbiont]|uniref:sensor domain-containing diguanylate cyclase n=1 Tax=Solemya pervernicosa gill symbiont TaxID=642797 RepID=UPI0022A9ABD6|nr:diguanylate cyclase [Solemya pervernicosa gill symbiont]
MRRPDYRGLTAFASLSMAVSVGVRWDESPQGRGPVGTAIRTGEAQLYKISDLRFKPWQCAAQKYGLASVYSLPLTIKGEVYGALTLYSNLEQVFDNEAEITRITSIANRLRIASDTSINQQHQRLLGAALSAAGSGVIITERDGKIVWVNESFCKQSGYSESQAIGQTPRILKSHQHDNDYYAELWNTILNGKRWASETVERHIDGSHYIVSQTITPIFDNAGEISHFIAIHEDITAQKEAQERIEYLAHHDGLTGIPNRALFYDRLEHTISLTKREKGTFALMFLDLDRFKPINDTYGHTIGDQLLQEVAQRIGSVLRESDTVARLGGDEFTVILPTINDEHEAFKVGKKLSEAISAPYQLGDQEIITSASIGIAIYPEHGTSDIELITAADSAMYSAKETGRHCIALASI